jgi:pimeloyl-ACP methyl ester carboxylesterase
MQGIAKQVRWAALTAWLVAASVEAAESASRAVGETPKGAQQLLRSEPWPVHEHGLPREKDLPLLNKLGRALDALPVVTNIVRTTRAGHDVRIAVYQYGWRTNDSILIFVHGVLADSRAWRYVAGDLGRDHEVWLIDLPGSGLSEAPDPSDIEPDGYSPAAIAERLLQVLDHCFADLPPRTNGPAKVTLVAHSLGGMVCLRMFSDTGLRAQYATVLRRVDSMALAAPCAVSLHSEIPVFAAIAKLNGTTVAVANVLGLVKSKTTASVRDGYFSADRATAEEAAALAHLLSDGQHRRAHIAMLKQAIPWRRREHRPDWRAISPRILEYANVDVPCMLIWGEWDEILPASMGHELRDEIPRAHLVRVEEAGHSLPREKPLEVAAIIRQFATSRQNGEGDNLPLVSRYVSEIEGNGRAK